MHSLSFLYDIYSRYIYIYNFVGLRLLLWSLMPLSTIFQLNMWRSVFFVEETGVHGENK